MRAEKQYLVDEVRAHLGKSDYVYLANYERITVAQTAELRKALKACGAEYHVVKNSTLAVALKETSYPSLEGMLAGQTAIIVGGKNPSEVAKALVKFFKATEKIVVKGGVLDNKLLSAQEFEALSKLPSFNELRAQLLSLLSTPASQFVRVLDAKIKPKEEAAAS